MPLTVNAFGGGLLGKTNATADTVYYGVIPGNTQGYARIGGFQYTCGNTANSFTLMRPIGWANIAAAAGTNVAVVTLDADPSPSGNTIAAGDQVVLGPCTDGTYRRAQVNTSGWNGTTLALTFTANLTAAVNTSTDLFNFGVAADTDPNTGSAHPIFTPTVNTTADVQLFGGGFKSYRKGDPLLVYNPNATAATNLNHLAYAYSAT